MLSRMRALFLKHEWLRGYFLLSPTLLFMICALAMPVLTLVLYSFWSQDYITINKTFTLMNYETFVDKWMCAIYDVLKRFGRWDQILTEPAPPSFMPVTNAVWRAARAVAYAANKDFDSARLEHLAFRQAKDTIPTRTRPESSPAINASAASRAVIP